MSKKKQFELGADVEKALILLATLDNPQKQAEMLAAWAKKHNITASQVETGF